MNKITDELLKIVSDFTGEFKGAFNIRENGEEDNQVKIFRLNPKKMLPVL